MAAKTGKLTKRSGISNRKFYKDLRFKGVFNLNVGGRKVKIYNNCTTIENELFWKGLGEGWENETIWLWLELSKQSKVIFDVGANTGIYSLLAQASNNQAEVHAFEPVQRTFQHLLKNIELNNFPVQCHQFALSDKNGYQIFYDTTDLHQYSASLSPDKLKNFKSFTGSIVEYEVTTLTIDKFIEQNGIRNIDLIKVDVELHEPEVIDGFRKNILSHAPIIFIEVLTHDVAEKLNALFKEIGGYQFFHLEDRNKIIPKKQLELITDKWNYLLCPDSKFDKISKYITL